MALIVLRYTVGGPTDPDLQNYVAPTAVIVQRFASPVCDVRIDDADFYALNEYMNSIGYWIDLSTLPAGYTWDGQTLTMDAT